MYDSDEILLPIINRKRVAFQNLTENKKNAQRRSKLKIQLVFLAQITKYFSLTYDAYDALFIVEKIKRTFHKWQKRATQQLKANNKDHVLTKAERTTNKKTQRSRKFIYTSILEALSQVYEANEEYLRQDRHKVN